MCVYTIASFLDVLLTENKLKKLKIHLSSFGVFFSHFHSSFSKIFPASNFQFEPSYQHISYLYQTSIVSDHHMLPKYFFTMMVLIFSDSFFLTLFLVILDRKKKRGLHSPNVF